MLDPTEIGVPMARGSQYLLLRRPADALAAYEEGARQEPRPEIFLNIGRAARMLGDTRRARDAFARAIRLNPLLAAQVPPEEQPSSTP